MTIEAIILWIGATVSLMLQYISWENCHSCLQWVGWLNSETLRIIIEQSNWVKVHRHCNTFWHFMINFQVFGKSCLDALLIRNKIKIAVILCFLLLALALHVAEVHLVAAGESARSRRRTLAEEFWSECRWGCCPSVTDGSVLLKLDLSTTGLAGAESRLGR